MIPIMVIKITNGIWKAINPRNTPVKPRKIESKIIIGLEIELNWNTSSNNINPKAASRAFDRKDIFFSCSSISPENLYCILSSKLKLKRAFFILPTTAFALKPAKTSEYKVTTRLSCLCLIALKLVIFFLSINEVTGISLIWPFAGSLKIIFWLKNSIYFFLVF